MTPTDRARILVVCTANIARSPLAEAMLQQPLDPDGFGVASAGVRARDGLPASDGSLELARVRGLDLSGHRSRQVTADMIEGSDLVLTMSERQRDRCASVVAPGTADTIFTIREFARLLDSVAPVDTRGRVARVVSLRAAAHAARPRALRPERPEDIEDPIGAPWDRWVAMGEDLDPLIAVIAARLAD